MKILISCPPVIENIEHFISAFQMRGWEYEIPSFDQYLRENEIIEIIENYDGWIAGDDEITKRVIEKASAKKLKCLVKWGIGIDNVDIPACQHYEIPFTNTPNMFGSEVSDLAICYFLSLARQTHLIDRSVRNGKWIKPIGESTNNKVVGIVGLGDIGRNIAKKLEVFDVEIIGWDPVVNDSFNFQNLKDFPRGVEKCDYIIFACALTDDNHHMLNDIVINSLKDGAKIINISRGKLIDERALIDGLKTGKVDSCALDVFENEPLTIDNELLLFEKCIFGTHNASNTMQAVKRATNEAFAFLDKNI